MELARDAWRHFVDVWFSDEIHDRFHDACEAADLTPPQLKALLSMEPGVAQPMRALADSWRCDASWVTGIVDGLEQRGYAARRAHATDRRVKVVEITKLGEKAKAKALDRIYDPPASFRTLTNEELKRLNTLMAKVSKSAPT